VTDARFRGFAQNQKDAAIDKLVKYHDEEYALRPDGVDTALVEAAKIKPQAASTPDRQPTTPPSTQAGPPTAQSVKADLAKLEAAAHDVATSKETINDPLRRVAGEDPVTYAYLKAQAERKDDKLYLKLLDEALPQHRRDYTTQQVKDLTAKGQPDEAMKLLSTQMDAATDPTERAELWKAAGEPVFSRAYFDQRLDKILNGRNLEKGKDLGALFRQVGENAPPEAANLLLDSAQARLDKGHDDPLWQALLSDAETGGEAYAGMSQLVERADSLGANRADQFAAFYVQAIDHAMSDRQTWPQVHFLATGLGAGLYQQAEKSITDHGAAELSVALYNAVKDRQGDPLDWSDKVESNVRNAMRNGIEHFRGKVDEAVDDWQKQNENALRLVQDFGSVDPNQVAQAIVQDRKNHPDTYYKVEDGKPTGVDVAQRKMEQRGVQLDGLMRDLAGLKIDFDDPNADGGVKTLRDAISGLDGDPMALSTLHNNVSLDEQRVDQLNFGHFDGNSPWNSTPVVGEQREYLANLTRDYHLPADLSTKLTERTDRWEKDLQAEVNKGDQASNDRLKTLTEDYRKDLQGLLKGRLPDGGEQTLVKPTDDMVTQIRTTLQSIGTVTSTLRLTMNWLRGTSDALLPAYTQLVARRGLNDPSVAGPDSQAARNAAAMGFADPDAIKSEADFMKKWQAKIEEKAGPNNILSEADRNALMKEFEKEAPKFGDAASLGGKKVPEAMKVSERFSRGLGAACFFTSALNNGKNATTEEGVTSSDAFALLFGTGAGVEAYRALKGQSMEGGRLEQALKSSPLDAWLTRKSPTGAEDMAKFIKSNSVGSLIALADMAWAYEDFTGETVFGNKTGDPDALAGWLTTGVVVGDVVEVGAAFLATRFATAALPVVGWVAAGVQAVFLGARFAYGVTRDKNKFEFDDNPDYADMVKSLGFTDEQARELMNENGGASDVKVDDWEWLVPGWNAWQGIHGSYGAAESFFIEGGMSPMHVLTPLFDANEVPPQQRLQYLQSLTPDEIKQLVGQTHKVLDDEMKDDGTITGDSTEGLEQWMKDHQLWKNEYLGAA